MSEFNALGKTLVIIGIVLIIAGGLLMFGGKIPFIGKMPGDISIQKKNFGFYFPITTCIIISIILSLLSWLFGKK